MFAKIVKSLSVFSVIFTIIFAIIYRYSLNAVTLSIAITFGTISYHFLMRLIVGYIINKIFHNKFNYNRKWFQEKSYEKSLYKMLKVKKWKNKTPAFTPEIFDFKVNTAEEIIGAMCQAEVVHLIIIVLCFVPISAALVYGKFWVFFITSFFAACVESMFVIIQRYNRPRVIRIIERKKD